jgi:hypothetical protein
MGSLGVGNMNSMAFSLLANSSSKVDKNWISFGTVDFQPHLSNLTPIFESMDQDMDLMIGSLNFHVGSLCSIHLSDLVKLDPSASEAKTVAMSESSVGSSSEANSPVSFAATEIAEGKNRISQRNHGNFDLEDQLEDLMICHDDTSNKSTDTWKTGLELH